MTHTWGCVKCEEAKVFKSAAHGVQGRRVRWWTALERFFEGGAVSTAFVSRAFPVGYMLAWGGGGVQKGI